MSKSTPDPPDACSKERAQTPECSEYAQDRRECSPASRSVLHLAWTGMEPSGAWTEHTFKVRDWDRSNRTEHTFTVRDGDMSNPNAHRAGLDM